MTVQGFTAPGFEGVRHAFEATIGSATGPGASFSAVLDGRQVVDIWAGMADVDARRLWAKDTVVLTFSVTKAIVATCLAVLADRGELDVDMPVAHHWPEFAREGKAEVRVAGALTHQAGVPGLSSAVSIDDALDPQDMAGRVAAQVPIVPAGSIAYHVLTFGWIGAELVRRIDGRSIGRFLADEIAGPRGLDVWIGLPAAVEWRVATVVPASTWGQATPFLIPTPEIDPVIRSVWANPPLLAGDANVWNSPAFRASELPGLNAIASARSLARLFGELSSAQAGLPARIADRSVRGVDALVGGERAYALGFELQTAARILGPVDDAFGHTGAGGSIAGAWPSRQVGFAYVTADLQDRPRDERRDLLLNALASALDR